MKKFVFTLERMLAYQEQNLEKEKGILARITAERDKLRSAVIDATRACIRKSKGVD